MKLSFQVADPAGNITILVTTPVPMEARREIAEKLLAIPELRAEQVGYLVPPQGEGLIRLEMMGGEFCGNALRSAALSFALQSGLRKAKRFPVECSGCSSALPVQVNPLTGEVEAEMPLPEAVKPCTLFGQSARAVIFPGIVHAICESVSDLPEEDAVRKELQMLCGSFSAPAAGIMFWNAREFFLRPAVYVQETNSLYFESSCASGSTAVAAWRALHEKDGTHRQPIKQPGGVIRTTATVKNGKLQRISIGGTVHMENSYEIEF